MMPRWADDLVGQRFGMWVVVSKMAPDRKRNRCWLCRCDCGNEKSVPAYALRKGESRSCGCIHRETVIRRSTKHGGCGTPEYGVWQSMRRRCNDAKSRDYPDYGGRGITVCERWASFESFLGDMGKRPSDQHQIDRTDNDGPYSPDNCRWVTGKLNCRNTRRNVILTLGERSQSVSEWAEELGISPYTIYGRIARGWSEAEALMVKAT